jgi:nodulation protein E
VGVVSALGPDAVAFQDAIFAGQSCIRPIQSVPPGALRFSNGAEVNGYDAALHFSSKELALLDPFAQYAVVAAREAVQRSGIQLNPQQTAVVTGSGGGGQSTTDDGFVDLYRNNSPRVNPFTIPRIMSNAGASHIAMEFGITGPAFTVSTACSSSNHAIGQAFWMVRSGHCQAAIAGGSDAVFSFGFLKSWEAMRVVSPDTCRPFSRNRQGMILGEGGAMLVLEDYDAARERGATILAEMVGFGMSSDASHITQPAVRGAVAAMNSALTDAGLAPEAVGYVNAHGTGTAANDPSETRAIREVFGRHADQLMVTSTKSMHGHALGAAGALEAVATVLALHHGRIPPTANYEEPDPECDLDYVPNVGRAVQVEYGMSNSFAFGGLNAVLLFKCC